MPKQSIIQKLSLLTEEEHRLLEDSASLQKELYSRSSDFLIEKQRLSEHTYGETDSPLTLRAHTRFTEFPPHTHDYIEMMYVCQGHITHTIGQEEVTLDEGDILLLGRAAVHAIHRTEQSDIGINILISSDFFVSICNRLRNSITMADKLFTRLSSQDSTSYCVFHTAGVEAVENILFNMISPLLSEKRPANGSLLPLEFELLASYLAVLPEIHSENDPNEPQTEQAIRKLNQYIETSYQSANLADAARILGWTPTYLCRWIRRHYKRTFKQLLNEKRFDVAQELLKSSSFAVNRIAEAVGYENNSYFHKEFRRRFGKTPKEMRKGAQKAE